MRLRESGEMYLETIYILSEKKKNVRAIDVGETMGFSKPSVSRALGILKKGGYVVTDENGFLSLTDTGLAKAKQVYERHDVISRALMRMGIDETTAVQDACRIEHVISDTTFNAIKEHLSKND